MTDYTVEPIEAAEGRIVGEKQTASPSAMTAFAYQFLLNSGTGLAELHAGKFRIPMNEHQAKAFAEAPEAVRQQLVTDLVRAAEARQASKRSGSPR